MPEEKVLNPGQGDPASSPEAKNLPAGDPSNTPDPGAKGDEGSLPPFHEVMKHPEFQPYLQKQIEEQVAARTAETVSQVLKQTGIVKDNSAAVDPDAEDLKQLMAQYDIDEPKARDLIKWRDRGIDRKLKPLEQRFEVMDLSARFGQVYRENPDAKQFEGKMMDLFNGMNDFEKNFVLHSKDGASYLYGEAKRRSGAVSSASRIAAGGAGPSASRSIPVSEKVGDKGTQVNQAVEALKKGDRASYEKIMAQVGRI